MHDLSTVRRVSRDASRPALRFLGASVAVAFLGMGTLFSLAVFLEPIDESTGWGRSAISSVALVNWSALGLGALVAGAAWNRLGTRVLTGAGTFMVGLGMVLTSQVTALWHLYLTFGVLVGLGCGSCYTPITAGATRWFSKNRGLAVGITSTGIGFGIMTIAPLSRWLISLFGWRTAMLVLGDFIWLVGIPAALMIRDAPAAPAETGRRRAEAAPPASAIFTSPQFLVIALAHFACCAAHSGPAFHMVTHAIDLGIDKMAAATVFSAFAISSVAGRIVAGMLADRFGAKPTLVAGLALQSLLILLYLFTRELWSHYALAALFGLPFGGVMPIYPLLVRAHFGERAVGTAYGGVYAVSCLGMGAGSYAGGLIFDHFGGYGWLFITSFAIGLAAVLLATVFHAEPRLAMAPAAR